MDTTSPNDRYERARNLVQRLQQTPGAFPHALECVECIETHISWLLLAGEHVYKFKKPLKLDFLDFSTPALRRQACEEELRTNRRTAPDIYLGLVAVTGSARAPRIVPDGEAAHVLEHAVHMRRFAQEALLSHLAQQQRLLPQHIDALALHVASFHATAAVAAPQGPWGSAQAVQAPVRQCLAALAELLDDAPLRSVLAKIALWCQAQGQALAPVFGERLEGGFVRECHGDLHLGNLVLLDGQPRLFDAIEFNPALRWIDVLADVAFLLMDLQARGCTALGWRFLNGWLERTGDYAGLCVLPYYLVYRALVRARVAGMRLEQTVGAERAACARELALYLRLAASYTGPRPHGLWLTHGLSGSGKSSQSQSLIEQRGMVRLRADVERKRLFGLAPEASSAGMGAGGIYTAEASRRTHERLAQLARSTLAAGFPVLVDATFLNRGHRTAFIALAHTLQLPCRILAFEAPLEVLRERVRQRARTGTDASEATLAVLEAQRAKAQPFTAAEEARVLHVDTTRPVDWSVLLPQETAPLMHQQTGPQG